MATATQLAAPLSTMLVRRVAVTMQAMDAGERLRALAEQLIGAPLLVGSLPPDLPLALPLPPDAILLGSTVYPPIPRPGRPAEAIMGERYEIVTEVPAAIADVTAFYDSALPPLSWIEPDTDPPPGRTSNRETMLRYTGFIVSNFVGPERYTLTVRAGPHDGGITRVRISVHPPTPPHREPPYRAFMQVQFSNPPDGTVRDGGGAGLRGVGMREWSVESPHTLEAVAAQLADQLDGRGWRRRDGSRDGPLVWSRWSVPDGVSDEAWLLVMETPTPRYYMVHVRVVAAEQPDGSTTTYATNVIRVALEAMPADDEEDRPQ